MKWLIFSLVIAGFFAGTLWLVWRDGYKRGKKSKQISAQPAFLADQVDLLFGLFLRAYALYLYVRPMMVNLSGNRSLWYTRAKGWPEELQRAFYWTFVLTD